MALVSLSNALKNGSASGIIGELDCSTVVTSELEESILFTKSIIQQKETELQKYNERQIVVKYNERQVQQRQSINHNNTPSPPTNITKEALLLLSNAELILQIRNSLL